jgi:hypothetical protein
MCDCLDEFDLETEFVPGEVRKIASLALIQEVLVNASAPTSLETNIRLEELITHDDRDQIADLVHMFYVAAKFRHSNIPLLVDILQFVIEKSQVPNAIEIYRCHLFPSFGKTNSRMPYRHRFICECIRKSILDAERVVASIKQFHDSSGFLNEELEILAAWYGPYLAQYAPDLAASLKVIDNPELYDILIDFGYPKGSIEYFLRTDDVAHFQSLIVGNQFSLDSLVSKSVFETAFLLENEPYYVHYAVYYGAVRCVKFMLLNNVDLGKSDKKMIFLLQFATAGGNSEIIRLLEQRKCYFNGTQQISALFHRNSVFDWLNETKYPITDYNDPCLGSILIQSVIGNNLSIFLLLLGRRKCESLVDFLCRDWTIFRSVLQAAAEHGHTALLRFLLSRPGLDVNARNQGNNTALHFACYYGHVEAVRMLLAYPGIDIRIRNRVSSFFQNVPVFLFSLFLFHF